MEDHPLNPIGKAPEFCWVIRRFDTLQEGEKGIVRSVRNCVGSSFIHCCSPDCVVAAFFCLGPSCLDCLACTLATLLRGEFGGSGVTTLLHSEPAERNSGTVLLRCHDLHFTCSGRNRSRSAYTSAAHPNHRAVHVPSTPQESSANRPLTASASNFYRSEYGIWNRNPRQTSPKSQ
jgi:hypothetical protein